MHGLRFGEIAFSDLGLEGLGEPEARLKCVGRGTGGPARIPAKHKEFVDGRGVDKAAHKIARSIRIDGPRPTQIGPDIFVVLGQCDELIAVRIGNVHQHKPGVEVLGQKPAQIARFDAIHRHAVVASIIARVEFEGQIVFYREFHAACPAPVAKAQSQRFGNLVVGREGGVQGAFCISPRACMPLQGAVVRVLGLHRNRKRRVFFKNGRHCLLQRIEIHDRDARGFGNGFLIDLPIAKLRPRQVVQKELRAGFVRRARPTKIIGLDVIEIGNLAQQLVPSPGLAKCPQLFLRGREHIRRELVKPVHIRDHASHRLAVSRVLRGLPRCPYPLQPPDQIRVRGIGKASQGLRRRSGRNQIRRHVIAKQVLQNIRPLIGPIPFSPQMLVRVAQSGLRDVFRQVRHGQSPLSSGQWPVVCPNG